MLHEMKLNDGPFKSIKCGSKTIEMRLFDEKRQLLRPRDEIRFVNKLTEEEMLVEIVGLHIFASFDELYKHFDKISLGYKQDEIAFSSDMEEYYSKQEQSKYGVVGIEIKLI